MKSLSRLGAIIKKEAVQLRRDRLTFGMVFGLPIIQILLFGFAINTDVRHAPVPRVRGSARPDTGRRDHRGRCDRR